MAKAAATTQAPPALCDKQVAVIPLDQLELDPTNPRFGSVSGVNKTQEDILDTIVNDYGIEDVISSLAVNGYFPAEPIICTRRRAGGKYIVVEGNRRLAACLVLIGDQRARNHARRTANFRQVQEKHHRPPITAIPVIWFEEGESPKELISYLGVRHLAASLPWDSYAKAAWVARVVQDGELTMEDISRMTGDQHRTIARLLHGYYVVGQLVQRGLFNPDAAIRKGRGSNAEFAFSWVYTLLGYPGARALLGIAEVPRPNPIPEERLSDASMVLLRLLGNKEKGRAGLPAIDDSRQIGDYAAAIVDTQRFELICKGLTLDEIDAELQPAHERLQEGLSEVEKLLGDLVALAEKDPPPSGQGAKMLPQAVRIMRLANALQRAIVQSLGVPPQEQSDA